MNIDFDWLSLPTGQSSAAEDWLNSNVVFSFDDDEQPADRSLDGSLAGTDSTTEHTSGGQQQHVSDLDLAALFAAPPSTSSRGHAQPPSPMTSIQTATNAAGGAPSVLPAPFSDASASALAAISLAAAAAGGAGAGSAANLLTPEQQALLQHSAALLLPSLLSGLPSLLAGTASQQPQQQLRPPAPVTTPAPAAVSAPSFLQTQQTRQAQQQLQQMQKQHQQQPLSQALPRPASSSAGQPHTNENASSASSSVKTEHDDDKRRRNTAASARFRAKKKMREAELERSAGELRVKTEQLERKVAEQEMEIRWLRQLVSERSSGKRLRDIYEENGIVFNEGTSTSASANGFQPFGDGPLLPPSMMPGSISTTTTTTNTNTNINVYPAILPAPPAPASSIAPFALPVASNKRVKTDL
ncbi:hypothetical protein HK101_011335 [Irineochytrium annulatum]|nr:hypothetical protein HK101_011335 [Irineochytrium annulatum]